MYKLGSFCSAACVAWLLAVTAPAQPAPGPPDPFRAVLQPASNTVMITETTNLLTVQLNIAELTNLFTNFVVTAWVPTNGYKTNILSTNVVNGELPFRFNDTGRSPDKTADDGTFSGNLITPTVTIASNLQVRVVVSAIDLFPTNQAPDDTNAAIVSVNYFTVYPVVPRPLNDNFTNAFKISGASGGVSSSTNNYASLEPREPQHGSVPTLSASIWWTWSAGFTTNVLVDVSGSSFRPVLAVYTGNALTNLKLVASSTNDIVNRLPANLSFPADQGVTYRIAVSGYDSNGVGSVRLRVAPGATADTRAPGVVITSPNREYVATQEEIVIQGTAREPAGSDSGISNILIQVNSGPVTNAFGTDSWSQTIKIPPGTNVVKVTAVDYAGNVSAPDAIVVRYSDPVNDNFASATRLTGVGGGFDVVTTRATREANEPLHANNEGGHSIWYSFRAAAPGTLHLSTAGSSYDTLLAIYVGDRLTNLTAFAHNDDSFEGSQYSDLSIEVLSNQVYQVAIDGYGGAAGNLHLSYDFSTYAAGQVYSVSVDALPGGTVSPPSSIYASGARVTFTATPITDYVFVGWEGDVTSAANPLTLTISSALRLMARFRVGVTNYVEDFETGNLRRLHWVTGPQRAWTVQTNEVSGGKWAARSAPVDRLQSSSLILVTNTLAGTGSFDLKVSSEEDWDYLEFYLNSKLLERWSGDVGWTNYPFTLVEGTNTMEWRYVKDTSFNSGVDAAYIDNLYVPLKPEDPATVAASLGIAWQPSRSALLTIHGLPNRTYSLESSTDLLVWIPMSVTNSESGVITFLDRNAARFPTRFYRAVAP